LLFGEIAAGNAYLERTQRLPDASPSWPAMFSFAGAL